MFKNNFFYLKGGSDKSNKSDTIFNFILILIIGIVAFLIYTQLNPTQPTSSPTSYRNESIATRQPRQSSTILTTRPAINSGNSNPDNSQLGPGEIFAPGGVVF